VSNFKLENVRQYHQFGLVPESLKKYFTLAKFAGDLEPEVSFEEVSSQYKEFCRQVNETTENQMEILRTPSEWNDVEYELYTSLCSKSSEGPYIKDIVHLLASAMVRTHCESVAESMGNIVKTYSQGRPVSHNTLRQEIFVRWNGPSPFVADNILEEALNLHFGSKTWHFFRSTDRPDRINKYLVSKTVDKKTREAKHENIFSE